MSDDDNDDIGEGNVIAFRNSDGSPVVVPSEIAYAADQPYRCYLMHMRGMSWKNIGEVENGLSARQVQSMVEQYLDEGAALYTDFTRKHLQNVALARYERIIEVHWPKMEEGSIASAGLVMNAMREQTRITRIDQPVLDSEDASTSSRTVVINDNGKGYSEGLKQVARRS